MVAEDRTPMFRAMEEDFVLPRNHDVAYCWRNVQPWRARAMVRNGLYQLSSTDSTHEMQIITEYERD